MIVLIESVFSNTGEKDLWVLVAIQSVFPHNPHSAVALAAHHHAAHMNSFASRIPSSLIEESNGPLLRAHRHDLEALEAHLARRGLKIERIIKEAVRFSVALPSWAFAQGGTRFGRFPAADEPSTLEQKLHAAALVNDLTGVTPRISLHIPWDLPADPAATRRLARQLELGFDAMNSNTFQDQPGQPHSYKFGSLSHTDAAVRCQAIEHNLHCLEIGRALGSEALTIWLADGANFPGQHHFRRALDRTIDSLENIYEGLPADWRLLVEYKPFEPAFYATVLNDWGTAWMVCQALGPRAHVLVDLGHHLPNTNIEQVVARLISARRLGGFHFNDSKYADDDLSTGSLRPYQLFLIFNELVDASLDPALAEGPDPFDPALMIDQSHHLKHPIEDLIGSALEIHRAFVKALLVNRAELAEFQAANDPVLAERALKTAFETDVSPILAEARLRRGAALDPILAHRAFTADYRPALRPRKPAKRPRK